MRFLFALFLTACSAPLAAQTIDCSKLLSSQVPFAIDYQVKRSTPKGPVTTNEQSQIFRKGPETISYNVLGPGRFVRARSAATPLFVTETYISDPPKLRRWTYSIDPNVDYLAKRQPLEFTAEQREEDGTPFLQAKSTIAFVGTSRLRALGCTFDIVKVVRTLDGTVGGARLSSRTDVWISPPLKASLFTHVEDGKSWSTYTTLGIGFDFKPVEQP